VLDVSLWNEVLGVEKTVSSRWSTTRSRTCWWLGSGPRNGRGVVVLCAYGLVLAMTAAMVGGSGGRWTWARSRRCWKPTHPGCPAAGTGWWLRRPWARHGTGHYYAFDDTEAWLTVRCSKTAVRELMRVAWRTVGSIITRVSADAMARTDRFANLTRIGIDEISYKKGHRYLTVIVDHNSRRLIWAAPGRDKATLNMFFDELGPDRCAAITHVSADAADWIADVVAVRCPAAVQCADAFHAVKWATEALDEVRRGVWNTARATARTEPGRRRGQPRADAPPRRGSDLARGLKNSRYAVWKNPENLTVRQGAKLEWIARTDPRLYRVYLLKEGLRMVFVLKGEAGKEALDRWVSWARRCRIPAFVDLQKRIVRHRKTNDATLDHGLSNGLIESTNTKIRVLTRMAFGFTKPEARVALAMLALSGYCPPLLGRGTPE